MKSKNFTGHEIRTHHILIKSANFDTNVPAQELEPHRK